MSAAPGALDPQTGLPRGVYTTPDGQLMRKIPRFVSAGVDEEGPYEEHDWREVPVMVGRPGDPGQIAQQQQRAKSMGVDFYHPTLGWLRRGQKREQEWPQNLGTVAAPRERTRRRVVAPEEPPVIVESTEVIHTAAADELLPPTVAEPPSHTRRRTPVAAAGEE